MKARSRKAGFFACPSAARIAPASWIGAPRAALAILCLVAASVVCAAAQDKPNPPQPEAAKSGSEAAKSGKEYLGPTADSIRPYRPANRDPFKRAIKPRTASNKFESRLLGFPPVEVRRAEYLQKVNAAHAADRAEPDPLSQYLVSELEVKGIFHDEHGFGIFVRALPTGTMFFARNGTRLYNGEVMRIAAEDADSANPKVLFREVTHMEDNSGKRTQQEHVVAKLAGGGAR